TGDRRGQPSGAGWEFVHVAVDDYSRVAYVELLAGVGARLCAPRPGVVSGARGAHPACAHRQRLGLRVAGLSPDLSGPPAGTSTAALPNKVVSKRGLTPSDPCHPCHRSRVHRSASTHLGPLFSYG